MKRKAYKKGEKWTKVKKRPIRTQDQKKALQLIILLASAFLVFFGFYLELYLEIPDYRNILLGLIGTCLFTFILNLFGWLKTAHLLGYMLPVFFVFWSSSTFGYESDAHYILVLSLSGLLMSYDRMFLFNTITIIISTIAASVALFLTDFQFLSYPENTALIQIKLSYLSYGACFVGTLIVTINYLTFYTKTFRDLQSGQEALLLKNQDLVKTNHQLDKFVYTVSHDLKSPVASVKALIDLHAKETDEMYRLQYMDAATNSLTKMQQFINELLDVSRHARLDVQIEPVAFESLIDSLLEEYRFAASDKKVKVKKEIREDVPFSSDKRRINIFLNNLISNAVRYASPEKDVIELNIQVLANQEEAIISIEDNGIGIKEEHQSKIFQMFYRVEEVKKNGSGIGLYLVKETVDKLGGTISLSSEYGSGSTFIVTIPNLAADKTKEQEMPEKNPSFSIT